MKNTERAYIAGLIDGEGCITICRRKKKDKLINNWYYQPNVIIANANRKIFDIPMKYGGWIAVVKNEQIKAHDNWKQYYHWKITGNNMRKLLQDTVCYLVIKKEQAQIVLGFPNYKNIGRARTKAERKKQKDLRVKIQKLNRKGK